MKWFVLAHIDATPERAADPLDEWKKSLEGYFFVSPDDYTAFKKGRGGSDKVDGHLYRLGADGVERDVRIEGFALRNRQAYVWSLPDEDVEDINDWVEERGVPHTKDQYADLYEPGLSEAAVEYFETHLVHDPETADMLDALRQAEEDYRCYQLRFVMGAAAFLRALDLCDVERAEDLPFELPTITCNIINGSQTKKAMEQYCDDGEERECAATLNMLARRVNGGEPYAWTRREVQNGLLGDDFNTLARVVYR